MTLAARRPTGQTMAYLPHPAPEALAEHIAAFANGDGGTVIVGADEKGHVTQGSICRLALAPYASRSLDVGLGQSCLRS